MITKKTLLLLIGTFLTIICVAQTPGYNGPHLSKKDGVTKLVVQGNPYLVLGGELGNSTSADMDYLGGFWEKLQRMNVNTVLAPVYWELVEPEEGRFDFSLVDDLLRDARERNMKLVLLWFGSWKNSMSCYVPTWVKQDWERFPRAQDSNGVAQEILTPFSRENLEADKKAYLALLQHLKAVDAGFQTVIMVQIENEIGMLPSARDHHPMANEAFQKNVPKEFVDYLQQNEGSLREPVAGLWKKQGKRTEGNWETLFGKSLATDEIFIAWYFSRYVDEMTKEGKEIYPLPIFVNAALNRPGSKPGEYPSGGPLPHLMDVWKAGAPEIDFLSPDFYNPDFKKWNDGYSREDNPLFIPEHRFDATAGVKAIYAVGHYRALGFAPFSIENGQGEAKEALTNCYALLKNMAPVVLGSGADRKVDAVLLSKEKDTKKLEIGNYRYTIKHDLTLGWSELAKAEEWPLTACTIIQDGENAVFVGGTGVVVTVEPIGDQAVRAGILTIDKGTFGANGNWLPGRRLNGDQSHQGRHFRIPIGEYDIQRVELYEFK